MAGVPLVYRMAGQPMAAPASAPLGPGLTRLLEYRMVGAAQPAPSSLSSRPSWLFLALAQAAAVVVAAMAEAALPASPVASGVVAGIAAVPSAAAWAQVAVTTEGPLLDACAGVAALAAVGVVF